MNFYNRKSNSNRKEKINMLQANLHVVSGQKGKARIQTASLMSSFLINLKIVKDLLRLTHNCILFMIKAS